MDPLDQACRDLKTFKARRAAIEPRLQVRPLLDIEALVLSAQLHRSSPERSKRYSRALNKIHSYLLELEPHVPGICSSVEASQNPHNHYKLVKYLVKTNLGMVWVAHNRTTNQPVVCKLSRWADMRHFTDNPEEETKVLLELLGPSGLGHPNVVKVLSEFRRPCDAQFYWCVLEYCPEGDVYTFVENTPSNPAVHKDLFRQMVAGVLHLHRRGLAHMDIKPDNFLLARDERNALVCKVCDPGMTLRFRNPQEGKGTDGMEEEKRFKGARGTTKYMAPEVFDSSNEHGPLYDAKKADTWSLGVVLFVLYFRGNPWSTPSALDERYKYVITQSRGEPQGVERHLRTLFNSWRMPCEPGLLRLLSVMLCAAPHRWTLEQVAAYSWLQEDSSTAVSHAPAAASVATTSTTTTAAAATVATTTTTATTTTATTTAAANAHHDARADRR